MVSSTEPPAAPSWSMPRGLIVLLGLAGATVAVAGLRGFADIAAPVFLALMLTVAVHPLQGWLQRRGWPTWLAMLATLASVYLMLAALGLALVVSIGQLATLLPSYQDELADLLDDIRTTLAGLDVGEEQIEAALGQLDLGNLVDLLEGFLTGLLGAFSDFLFVLAALLFMAIDGAGFPRRLAEARQVRPDIVAALSAFARGTRRYLVVSTVFGAIVAVLDAGALALLGIPLPVLWGLLAFITNYIPNIGFVVGLIPPALLGLLHGGLGGMLAVIAVYSVINVVIQSIIQPKYVGDAVGLSTTLTFLSLVFWAWVIGPLGALLAIPLTLLTKALLLDIDPSSRWLSALISSGPARPVSPAAAPAVAVDPGPPALPPPAAGGDAAPR
jgi:predicted PurR-regulated permease PerM